MVYIVSCKLSGCLGCDIKVPHVQTAARRVEKLLSVLPYKHTCIPVGMAHLFMSPIVTPTLIPWNHSVKSHADEFQWSHTKMSETLKPELEQPHECLLCWASLQTHKLLPAAQSEEQQERQCVYVCVCVYAQISVSVFARLTSVERCRMPCRQRLDLLTNNSSPHPLPSLTTSVHPVKTQQAASGWAMSTCSHEHMNTWTYEHMNIWTHDHMNTWTYEHMNTWTRDAYIGFFADMQYIDISLRLIWPIINTDIHVDFFPTPTRRDHQVSSAVNLHPVSLCRLTLQVKGHHGST